MQISYHSDRYCSKLAGMPSTSQYLNQYKMLTFRYSIRTSTVHTGRYRYDINYLDIKYQHITLILTLFGFQSLQILCH